MSNFDLTRFTAKRGKHGEYIVKNGKRYREREGRLIEVEMIVTKAGAKAEADKAKRGRRYIGCSWSYLTAITRLTTGRAAVLVAQYIYRRVLVCKNRTVTLPGAELAELGVDRERKSKALRQLARAGIIRIEDNISGRTAKVTLLCEE
jgi:hypothetical protein